MKEAVIVSGARTAIGSFGGVLKSVPVIQLGSTVMKETLKRVNLRPVVSEAMLSAAPDALKDQGVIELEEKGMDWDDSAQPVAIDEVIMGNVLTSGQGQNPARQAMVQAGICKETPAFTINKVCASGLKAIALGAASIMTGQADVILAGGQESMSNVPMALPLARWGYRMAISGKGEIDDLMVLDGLYEIFYGYHMGVTAENIASKYGITREEQDALGVLSHNRARKAITEGLFKDEIVPVSFMERRKEVVVDTDERPMDTSMEKMAKLRPAFIKDGTVTAGNASGINDGAASVLLMSAEKAQELGLEPLAKIKAFASAGMDPAYMGLGPIPAVRKVLKATGMSIDDLQMLEVNEAFASQAIACLRELGIDTEKPNELGSGISLGHPIGCTGARQMVTAIHHMERKGYNTGLITMCIGGGMGMAMIIEK
ncbi:Acetyl-CoA acetyltransferase (thiolase II-like) [Desulfatibacillum aliphaticivorans]|uniref:Acetyl-CoA acetyltransferase (Thiolase II-like) n=1 Tax=Desulfatibacillum aliphaticivorans TaxID=218208 RepID=B8FHB1_DESAL|nr:acetyl-CoA C-acetyltransferase [Desulfatibacillum aliphaticivorans]ACL02199.1 Acetyl-CoA acetyltransferase (thiolase II-like) [Desulfatibacillum aliphaticivorans]